MKTLDDGARRYAEKSLMTFLEGGLYTRDHKPQSINWIIGVIQSSGIRGSELMSAFQRLNRYGDPTRHSNAFAECQRHGWFNVSACDVAVEV